jgi:rhamnogalacturonan endolyase
LIKRCLAKEIKSAKVKVNLLVYRERKEINCMLFYKTLKNYVSTNLALVLVLSLIFGTMVKPYNVQAAENVTITESSDGKSVTLANSNVSLSIVKDTGQITTLQRVGEDNVLTQNCTYYSCNYSNDAAPAPTGAYYTNMGGHGYDYSIVKNTGSSVELAFTVNDATKAPFYNELHYVLNSNDQGYYMYIVQKYPSVDKNNVPYPANLQIIESRYIVRVPYDPFNSYALDEERKGQLPSSSAIQNETKLMDETYKLANDESFRGYPYFGKYMFTKKQDDPLPSGYFGNNTGVFMIKPNDEAVSGGPEKQDIDMRPDYNFNDLYWYIQSEHYGTPRINVPVDWQKIYGPVFVYLPKGSSLDEVWESAKAQAKEEAAKWPYSWVTSPAYDLSDRVKVEGTLKITDGTSPENALVILGDNKINWQYDTVGYKYYAHADKDGHFSMLVRPGTYKLYSDAKGVLDEYQQDNIVVNDSNGLDLGTINWTPITHGEQLWQIGTPDRDSAEFKYGDKLHSLGPIFDYPVDFPNGINYTVGTSDPKNDFPYFIPPVQTPGNQSELKEPMDYTTPKVNINFVPQKSYTGNGTFTLAVSASVGANLNIKLNGVDIFNNASKTLFDPDAHLDDSDNFYPSGQPFKGNDSSLARLATRGLYKKLTVTFDASLLKPNENNVLTLSQIQRSEYQSESYWFNSFMVDCMRLEAQP